MHTQTALEVQNVGKTFAMQAHKADSLKGMLSGIFLKTNKSTSAFEALRQVHFSVKKGEALGIIGKNGAGKSTLLKILAGILEPDTGSITFYGKTVSILDIGAGFHPDLSGRENIYFASSLYGFTRNQTTAVLDDIITFSGIHEFIDEPVKHYSSGMYLRLAFAVIAHLDADIYLIDEVIQVGDAAFQAKCKNKLQQLMQQGKTLLVASHNMTEISLLCNRVILLENGTVIADGGWDVIKQYMSVSLPQFIQLQGGHFINVDFNDSLTSNDKTVQLNNIQVTGYRTNEDGIDPGSPLTITVDFIIHQPMEADVALRFYNSAGLMVFGCSTLQQQVPRIQKSGVYQVVFEVPGHLFNVDYYYADLLFIHNLPFAMQNRTAETKEQSLLLNVPRFLSFRVSATYNGNAFYTTHSGALNPYIPARVQYVSQ